MVTATELTLAIILYYNSSGTMTVVNSGGYGFYATGQTPTLSSNTANTITITLPRPKLYARCSATYMAKARAEEIDKENSKLYLRCEVFRVRKDCTRQAQMKALVEEMNQ